MLVCGSNSISRSNPEPLQHYPSVKTTGGSHGLLYGTSNRKRCHHDAEAMQSKHQVSSVALKMKRNNVSWVNMLLPISDPAIGCRGLHHACVCATEERTEIVIELVRMKIAAGNMGLHTAVIWKAVLDETPLAAYSLGE